MNVRLISVGLVASFAGASACAGPETARENIRDTELPLDAAGLTVTTDGDALAGSLLLPSQQAITITSAVYEGASTAAATYVEGPLGLASGALLTTGAAVLSLPPDDGPSTGQSNGLPGSPLCDALIPGFTSTDAAKLTITFDLAPGFDGISVLSVFGSEEYDEWVGSQFNDVYGLYLNGQQIAFDEGGNPITINGPFFSSSAVVVTPATETEYDGSTGVLQTKATLAGGTTGNVLEIVICDAGDTSLDSGVFLANLNGCVGDDCSGTKPCEVIDDDADGVTACTDCDDTNPAVAPGIAEACDGIDNDCDAEVDEGGVCVPTCITFQRGTYGDVQDTYLTAEAPNYAASSSVDLYTGLSGGGEKRSLVKFDISEIPAGATVTSATFTIEQKWSANDSTVRVHQVLAPWTEATATWNNFPAGGFDPGVLGTFATNGAGPRVLDATGLAQQWVSGIAANEGFLLEETPVVRTYFRSSEETTVALRPKLEVCFLP